MQVRQLTVEDAALFWDLRLRALKGSPEVFGSSYEESINNPPDHAEKRLSNEGASPDNFVLGAWDGAQLIGMVGLRREEQKKMQHKAMIWGVWVEPEARGRGVARALMQEAIARARTIPGLEQLYLSVVTTNDTARRLYRSLGFEVYGLEPHALKVDGCYMDEELMVLWLV
jgi:ribosomal protein S18 acetylase RimI-like enzyme